MENSQRQIKFRAWDGEAKKMIFWTLNDLLVRFGEPEYQFGVEDRPSVFFDWMQFTGLLDKNGKEIYEGDIIESIENNEVWRVDEMFPVHRQDHVTNIGYFDGKKYHTRENPAAQYNNLDDWMSMTEFYEIIGNIYDNPNLISK